MAKAAGGSLRVAVFHPTKIPPLDYGGTERVVVWLIRSLQRLGHRVTLFAATGSRSIEGSEFVELSPESFHPGSWVRSLKGSWDVIHLMSPPDIGFQEECKTPWLFTLHGNGREGEKFPLDRTVFISRDHAKRHGGTVYVHHGLDPDELQVGGVPQDRRKRYLFFSRTHLRTKNLKFACRVARTGRLPLDVAGGERPWSSQLRVHLESVLGMSDVRWLGSLENERKRGVLASSRGLVFPVKWQEPFGLVVIESLISGAPVFGVPWGSLPELVGPGDGKLWELREEIWREGLRRGLESPEWDSPNVIAERAMERFHMNRMAKDYLRIYTRLLEYGSVGETM